MNKKYLQSLARAIKPGGLRCLPKKRSSDTFKKKDKPPTPPIVEFPNNDTMDKRHPSVTSITTFKENPEVEYSDKEKPVVIVVVVNKRGNANNAFGENIQSPQREWQSSPLENYSGSNKQESCSCPPRGATPFSSPDYVEHFQRLEELICKCAGQKGFGFNSQNTTTSRSGNSCTHSNKSSPTQYQQYPMSTRNYEQRKQPPQQCQQQFKQKQQFQSPQQQCHIPQQQPLHQCQTPQQQSQRYYTSQQQSHRSYQPQQQCYQPQLQQQQSYQPQLHQQQSYQPQLHQQHAQQPEQCLKEPQQSKHAQQYESVNGNDINCTCPLTSVSSKVKSRQQSSNGLIDTEYCQFELPVCVTKSTFQKLQSAGINQTQPLGKCLDTNSQYSNEKSKYDPQLSEYDDSTMCTCEMKSNCCDYCTCMEKKTPRPRKRKRKKKGKNMLCTPEKTSNRVILRDIGLPNRCYTSCPDVPCSPYGGTRCCNTGGCCNGMW